jgi:delta 1-pyrroline-5-carboxylate dehydrogenase
MTIPKPTEDLNVVSIWSKISTKEREALKAVADQREQTISQLIRFCLKEQGCLG